jgi:hypothetical protein
MPVMDCATGEYRDAGIMEMGCSMGSIYLGDTREDRPLHISSYLVRQHTIDRSHLLITLVLSDSSWVPAFVWILMAI